MNISEVITPGRSGFLFLHLVNERLHIQGQSWSVKELDEAATAAGFWVYHELDENNEKYTGLAITTKEREPNGD
jgi:hypothetical protein